MKDSIFIWKVRSMENLVVRIICGFLDLLARTGVIKRIS